MQRFYGDIGVPMASSTKYVIQSVGQPSEERKLRGSKYQSGKTTVIVNGNSRPRY